MRWPGIESLYGQTLRQSPVFAEDSKLGVKTGSKTEGKTTEEVSQPGVARWEELHKRVVEHVSLLHTDQTFRADEKEHSCHREILLACDNATSHGAARLVARDDRTNAM